VTGDVVAVDDDRSEPRHGGPSRAEDPGRARARPISPLKSERSARRGAGGRGRTPDEPQKLVSTPS
jgi:hypothetical protein